MSYSSDERSAAVGALVQGTLSFQQDALGPLDTATEFTEVMEIVYSVLLYDPDAIFYLIYLARNGIKQVANAEIRLCDDLLDAIDDLAMPNRPVENVTSIASARNALQSMDAALIRGGGVAGSEYRRYQQALTRAKNELSRTVKSTFVPRNSTTPVTDIVRPSDEAKVDVSRAFASAKEEHSRLLFRVASIQTALSEFAGGKLASRVGRRQVLRAHSELDNLYELLEGLTSEERILQARQALLTLLANESVIKALATIPIPGTAKFSQPVSSSPQYRLQAHGEGTAPTIIGTISAPYPLFDSTAASPTNLLSFADLNGSTPADIDLFPTTSPSYRPGIKPATVSGNRAGPFAISTALATPHPLISTDEDWDTSTNNIFHIKVDGVAYECELTQSATLDAATAKTDLDTTGNWKDNQKPELTFSSTGGKITVTYDVGSPPASYAARSMEVVRGFGHPSDMWDWKSGPSGTTTASRSAGWDANNEIWVKANDDPSYTTVTLPSGTWPGYAVTAAAVKSSIDSAGGSDFEASVAGERVSVSSELSGEGSIITMLADVPDTASARGLSTLGFVKHQESRKTDVPGSSIVSLLNNDPVFSVGAVARMVRQDLFTAGQAYRNSDQVLVVGSVESDPTAGWPAFSKLKVSITSGDNRGIYSLTDLSYSGGGSSLILTLDRRLRDSTADLLHTVNIYRDALEIASLDSSLTGSIQLDHPANSARNILGFDGSQYTSAVNELELEYNDPTYSWRALDVSRLQIRIGDRVLDGAGDEQATITSVGQLSSGVFVVSPSVAPFFSLSTEGFSVQSGAFVAYQSFINALESWASDLSPYEEDLDWIDRSLGPILLTTPTRDRVGTAYDRVSLLKTKLEGLTTLLDSFSVTPIGAVDAALQALLERGFDRARQMLITGRLAEFFAATASNASFSRAFQQAANEFVVQDVNRGSQARARFDSEFVRLRESWEEDQHPDYDFSDFEEEPPEDAVVDYYQGVNEREGT